MDAMKTSTSEIVIAASEIQGNPRPKSLGQWVPREERPWWTEEELARRSGLKADRTTGRFLERTAAGWRFKVFTDIERSALFLSRGGSRP